MTLEEALQQAQTLDQARHEAGFDQQALDAAARQGFANGAFEDTEDESRQVLEEFYPDGKPERTRNTSPEAPPSLQARLQARADSTALPPSTQASA